MTTPAESRIPLRPADARFLLPRAPTSGRVIGELDGWRAALDAAGIHDGPQPEVVIAPASCVQAALASHAPMVIIVGAGGRKALRRSGMVVRRYLAAPRADHASAFVPVGDSHAAGLWNRLAPPTSVPRHLTRTTVGALMRTGILPWFLPQVSVAAKGAGPPFPLASALTGARNESAVLVPGGDQADHKRNVFRVPASHAGSGWVVKVARMRGDQKASDRDAAGLQRAAAHGPLVRERVPAVVARLDVDGYDVLVETEVGRRPLVALLGSRRTRSRKLAVIEEIGRWLVDLSATTQVPSVERRREWQYIERETESIWPAFGAPRDLFDRIRHVPGVLQHGDLWIGNITWGDAGFRVVDWELARDAGIPIGDLAMFVPEALAIVDGARTERARLDHFVSLWEGRLPSSAMLFRLVDGVADACDLTPRQVGALVTVAILASGVPPWYDRHLLPVDEMPLRARFARAWLDSRQLGPDWPAWSTRADDRRGRS